MRLEILERGYRPATKALFAVVRLVSRQDMPDAAKLMFYRPDFYGARAKAFTQEAMRGPSEWSVAERELMAAYVSAVNSSAFCVGAHTATASRAYGDSGLVAAALEDVETAPVSDPLRATLRMLGRLTVDGTVSTGQVRGVLAAGATASQVADALAVGAAFNLTNRLADAFDFAVPSAQGFESGAKYLLRRGYR
ncbi:carboxymuconolactone decarboxylase family protein [Actinospica sp. MGRD01-02]|uniref:Carboxymuconolactone decarboxylase family protein n=1 Tax=Actinospica acidithermotolerans TaxID=2828514 RepID=A0A941EKN1_9ACTN|nr:carboxymuconolactone decarboxylase family protein [Actinospica acidithermotolerans]MBR7830844.1 carboxymuconolactone decarboxylase family protein [Actinospica acidithermotolerans]